MSRSAAAGPVPTFDVGSRTDAAQREGDITFIGTATVLVRVGPLLDTAERAGVAARILHLERGQRWELSLPSEKGMQR